MSVIAKAEVTISDILDGNSISEITNFYKVSSKSSGETAPQTSGGRNLLLNSDFSKGTNKWTAESGKLETFTDATQGQCLIINPNNKSRAYYDANNIWKAGQVYSYSFMAKASVDGVTIQPSRSIADYSTSSHSLTTKWERYEGKIKSTLTADTGTLSISVNHSETTNPKIYIAKIKLEYGNVATDWTPAPEDVGWSTTVPTLTATNKYLWNYEMITGSDGQVISYTEPRVIGVYGDKGNTGSTGATGNGIKSITEYYQISTSNTTAPTSWVTTVPTLTATNKYLWNYEKITYTNGTSVDTAKRVIGVYGDKGNTGATGPAGKGIKSTAITYQASTSGTTAPTGTWNTSVPSVPQGQYLWSRTVITYTDNSTSTTYSVAYIPKNGQNGATGSTGPTGPTGTGVASIVQQYYLSTSKTSQTGGSWVTSMPTWSSGKYLWTRYQINYKNPTSTAYTSPICDSSWEAVNDIQVGGRNLFRNSSMLEGKLICNSINTCNNTTSAGYSDEGYHLVTPEDKGNFNNGVGFYFKDYTSLGLLLGDTITYSCEIKGITTAKDARISVKFYGTSPEWYGSGVIESGSLHFTTSETFQKVYVTFTIPDDPTLFTSNQCIFCIHGSMGSDIYIRNLKLEKGNVATDWTPAPEDVDTEIEKVTTKYTQLNNKFKWVVESGTSATDFTLTDRTATLIAQTISLNGNVKVNGTMLVDKSITTPKLATDAIKSTNYAYSSGNFSTAGTFLDLSSGIFRSKNFAVDSSGNAYFKGNIQANAGYIGGADGWSISTNRITGNANSKIVSGILESSNFVDGSAGVQINLNSGIIKGNIEATSLAAKEVIQIYTGSTRRNIIKGYLSNDFFYTMIGCDLKIGSTNLVTPYIALNKSTTSGTANDLIQISSKSVDIYGATTINDGLYTSTITSSGEIKTSTNMICNDVRTRTGWAADRLSNGQTAYIGLFNGRMRFEWTGSSINVYVDNTLVRNNW